MKLRNISFAIETGFMVRPSPAESEQWGLGIGRLRQPRLRRMLRSYAEYYNRIRTHRSLNKDAPISRLVERTGIIRSRAVLGGLHHQYMRVQVFGTHSRSIFNALAI